ncbi:methionine ABC transporter ATP-binding protein [Brevibacillus reuszeri]|uniref:methionine ABC transporter ATP-binding protein n=1 Tax=Brevibacillus reuszeri TaxID=54915 RepID=UPI002897225B|nr:methionine ABC transporter ATP-binding protein [Brevibacillus reuszeri]
MIKLTNVSKSFQTKKGTVHAIDDVSLEVQPGEIFGVIGYSGAGKSTLIRCVNLLESPTTGSVIINGRDVTNVSAEELLQVRRKIGMIFQGFNLLKTATVYDNIAIPLKLTDVDKKEIDKRVQKYLQIVGLEDKHDAYPGQLSGGQKQRVAIARALAQEPEILLSDEATSALDPETTESILELLLKINEELGITIMLITHEMNVIQKICDRVAVMEKGKVIEQGKTVDIYARPSHPTTKRFVNSTYHKELPPHILQDLIQTGPVVRLTFVGESSSKPVLASVSAKFPVSPNILAGGIIALKQETIGALVVHLHGDKEETIKAISYLEEQGVKVEGVEVTHV